MSTIMHINTETARFDPASAFERPMDVVSEVGLTRGQKLAALQRWADSLHDRLAAASEGMQAPPGNSGKDVATLDEIAKAQAVLRRPEDVA